MNKYTARHTAISIIFFFSFILFIKLDMGEVQPWDEGLFAVRAQSINKYNAYWDQTQYSIGGLYSATYPPLTVWAMALNMRIFGERLIAIRLLSALCGSISLIFIFLLARRLMNSDLALLSIIALAVTGSWNYYARQGMTDIPLVAFILISLWAMLKLLESERKYQTLIWTLILALAFGAALMTKIVISFLPLLFIAVALFRKEFKRFRFPLILASVLGIGIALPWHIYMIKTHGYEFYRAFFAPHIYSSVESNSPILGLFYYLNQMIVANPFLLLGLIFIPLYYWKFRPKIDINADEAINDKIERKIQIKAFLTEVLVIWLGLGFVIFSIAQTKLPHYLLYLIPPAILLAGKYIRESEKSTINARLRWFILSFLVISIFWAFNYDLRQGIKNLLTFREFQFQAFVFILIAVALVGYGIRAGSSNLNNLLAVFSRKLFFLFLIFLVIRLVLSNSLYPPGNTFGAAITADNIQKFRKHTFVYVYHRHNASDSLNPQLAWYTKGWSSGQMKGHKILNVPLPKNLVNLQTIASTDILSNLMLIYQIPEDFALAHTVIREISEVRPMIRRTSDYAIFGAVHNYRKPGKPV